MPKASASFKFSKNMYNSRVISEVHVICIRYMDECSDDDFESSLFALPAVTNPEPMSQMRECQNKATKSSKVSPQSTPEALTW